MIDQSNLRCSFWNFNLIQARYVHTVFMLIILSYTIHHSGSGGWDTTGVTTIDSNDTFITCSSTHLTSFAVLVDVSPGQSTKVRNLRI